MKTGQTARMATAWRVATVALATAILGGCASAPRFEPVEPGAGGVMRPYQVNGVWYRPALQPHYDEKGLASWYGPQSHYRTTADGEAFDERIASAAHKTLPLPCIVEVTNLDNGRRARLRVNDRGPFVAGRILDVSRKAAEDLGFQGRGVARVRVRYIGQATGADATRLASIPAPSPRADEAPLTANPAVAGSPVSASLARTSRVQAGAFADRTNADRAAAALSGRGEIRIEPIGRGDAMLWRVIVVGRGDPDHLRRQVTSDGYAGARILEP